MPAREDECHTPRSRNARATHSIYNYPQQINQAAHICVGQRIHSHQNIDRQAWIQQNSKSTRVCGPVQLPTSTLSAEPREAHFSAAFPSCKFLIKQAAAHDDRRGEGCLADAAAYELPHARLSNDTARWVLRSAGSLAAPAPQQERWRREHGRRAGGRSRSAGAGSWGHSIARCTPENASRRPLAQACSPLPDLQTHPHMEPPCMPLPCHAACMQASSSRAR